MKTKLNLFMILTLFCAASALGNTLLVDDNKVECPDAGYSTIQGAVDAAVSGDVIQVCPGTYSEQVEIAKPLSLVGVESGGMKAAVLQPSNIIANSDFFGPEAAIILVHDTSDVTIKNITVDGINNGNVCGDPFFSMSGIFYRNASGAIESVAIKNMLSPLNCAYGDTLDVLSIEGGIAQVTIKNSSLHDYDSSGVLAVGPKVHLSALGNVITGLGPSEPGQAGIQLDQSASGLIADNVITNQITASDSTSGFVSHGIGAFQAEGNTTITRNTVGNNNTAIYVGAIGPLRSNTVKAIDNTVFDSTLHAILVGGDSNLAQGNKVTNSGLTESDSFYRAGIAVQGFNNAIQDNTVNEAVTGLLVSTGHNVVLNNRLFNTPVTTQIFTPGVPSPNDAASVMRSVLTPKVLKMGAANGRNPR